MVRFQIASDLHIEYKNNLLITDLTQYITPSADILILAGDIGNLSKFDQLKSFLKLVCQKFTHVLYVPGNHEYYSSHIPFAVLNDRLIKLGNMFSNLVILNRKSVCIDDVCIIGCTLWSKAKIEIPSYINIVDITTKKYNDMHIQDLQYIMKMIDYCRVKNMKLLVITHHVPTYKLMKDKNEENASMYATDLDHLLRYDYVHTWICGHIHRNFDFTTLMGTRLVGNQYGKPKDNITDYKFDMTIEI